MREIWINGLPYSGYVIFNDDKPWQAAYRMHWRLWGDGIEHGYDNLVCWKFPEPPTNEFTQLFIEVRKHA